MKKLITKERLCTLATILYHSMFLGGASFYVTEFQKTRDVIVEQVDRVEKIGADVRMEAIVIQHQADSVIKKIDGVRGDLDKVKRACERLRF